MTKRKKRERSSYVVSICLLAGVTDVNPVHDKIRCGGEVSAT